MKKLRLKGEIKIDLGLSEQREMISNCTSLRKEKRNIFFIFKPFIPANIYEYFPYIYLLHSHSWKSAKVNCQGLIGELILLFSVIAITNVGFNEVITFPLQKSNPDFLYYTQR